MIAYFLLADAGKVPDAVQFIDIPGYAADLRRMGRELGRIWNSFFRGQILIVMMVIITYTIMLSILGVQLCLRPGDPGGSGSLRALCRAVGLGIDHRPGDLLPGGQLFSPGAVGVYADGAHPVRAGRPDLSTTWSRRVSSGNLWGCTRPRCWWSP